MTAAIGVAGRLAATFIHSRLTPLFIIASLALGAFAVVGLPREEEPQIIVPMVDVFVQVPGATPAEVEQRVTRPMEKLLWEVPGVEYIYSTSSPGGSMAVVRFEVGEDDEKSIVKLNQKMYANFDLIRSEEHTSELQSRQYLVCRLLLEKKKQITVIPAEELHKHSIAKWRCNHATHVSPLISISRAAYARTLVYDSLCIYFVRYVD